MILQSRRNRFVCGRANSSVVARTLLRGTGSSIPLLLAYFSRIDFACRASVGECNHDGNRIPHTLRIE